MEKISNRILMLLERLRDDQFVYVNVGELRELVASHAPSDPPQGFKVVDEWGPRELEASPSPWQNRSEAAAKPTEDAK